jgi:hypothetical protein
MQQFVGQKIEAITLNVISDNAGGTYTEALTDNYLKMKLVGRLDANQLLRADVTNVDGDTLIATPISELATYGKNLSQTRITRAPSEEFTCQETIPTRPAA